MLATVRHINLITFFGYCVDPFLLIVMDFVSGGTVSDFIENTNPIDPPSMSTMMTILIGSATGLAYLHGTEPMPILHRDIKSENILLTDACEPRIADLGEARVMAEDHAMTAVGTQGYTAPEILRGEHYDTSADVFSFAIVMCELLTMRAPYSDMRKNGKGETILTWPQITAMSEKKEGGLRPSLPEDMDEALVTLIRESWASNASLRPSFSVIVARLTRLARSEDTSSRTKSRKKTDGAESILLDEDKARELCRSLHELLVHYKPGEWNRRTVEALVDKVSEVFFTKSSRP